MGRKRFRKASAVMASPGVIATIVLLCLHLHLLSHFSVLATTISGSNSSRNDAGHRDIDCLQSIKSSFVEDPLNLLTLWDFANDTNAGLCRFHGIDCWHTDDNNVLGIHLPNMGLAEEFPRGIENCDSITSLNLSGNNLSGPIPSDIASMLPFLTILDLSNNKLSGEIPASLFNCSYLNVLRLDKNRLTGRIPDGIQQLGRLRNFSVSHNSLSGRIPAFERMQGIWAAGSFVNNSGLCGSPLDPCSPSTGQTSASQFLGFFRNGFIVGFALVELSVLIYVYWFCIRNRTAAGRGKNKAEVGICRSVADYGRCRNVKISDLEALATRMSFRELSGATSNFSADNIIGTGTTGTMYKAMLPNGWFLAVKRLHHPTVHFNPQFISDIMILGRWRHQNLLPILGFCIHNNEKLLVYKYMSNGTLRDWLLGRHHRNIKCLDWPLRFKIAVGLARGLAWLHLCCSVQIFHLNLTSRCVLLDQGFEPKLSNFGGAMFVNPNDHDDRSRNLVIDKGFLELGFAKKDVHSFGVVVLELISGKEVIDGESFGDQIDECVAGKSYEGEIVEVMRVARDCVQPMVERRPTMLQVVQKLTQIGQGCCGDGQGYQPVVVPSVLIDMGQGIGSKYRLGGR